MMIFWHKHYIFLFCFWNIYSVSSQTYCDLKYDNIWILGGVDDTLLNEYGGCELNFTNGFEMSFHPKQIEMPFSNISFSSQSGELLFYSNGCVVINGQDQEIENGYGLNPGEVSDIFCPPNLGYPGTNMIVIPDPIDQAIYYLLHVDEVYNENPHSPNLVQSQHLYYTTIDVYENSGSGKVINKNNIIINDTSMLGSPVTAVRHANGTDWWIVIPERWNNGFFTVLFNNESFNFIGIQYVGNHHNHNSSGGQGKFSPDGLKYAWYHPKNGLFLYDFNRETGILSNFIIIEIPPCKKAITGGCEFSPSGRFLYVNHDTSLFQLDLFSNNIDSSLTHIADYDKFGDPLPTSFFYMERTPDKRILMNVLNGSQYLHVIQEPDKKGVECRFEQHSIMLPTVNNFTIPHFPNYRLGALGEPLCDSLPVADHFLNNVSYSQYKIMPNPASDYFSLIPPDNFHQSNIIISIYNLDGKLLLESKELHIYTSSLPDGIYLLSISEDNLIVQNIKLVISGH